MAKYPVTGSVVVVADDTDVFALLVHFRHASAITTTVFMESPKKERTVIDIDGTVEDNLSIIPGLLAAHALTGCDIVTTCYGIGKGTALKVLRAGWYLLKIQTLSKSF